MNEDEIGKLVIDASMKVHTALGAGLLETIYETLMILLCVLGVLGGEAFKQ